MDRRLYERLIPVIRRIQFRRLACGLALTWLVAAIVAVGLFVWNQLGDFEPGQSWLVLLGATGLSSCGVFAWALFRRIPVLELAQTIEGHFPELDASLLTAIEQRKKPGEPLGFLQLDVLRTAVNHSYSNRWGDVIPTWQLFMAPFAAFVGMLLFLFSILQLSWNAREIPQDQRVSFDTAAVERVDYEINVEPGNASVERGTSLLVLARFGESIPPDATLVVIDENGEEQLLPMKKSLDDPVFGARVSRVKTPLKYRIEYAAQQSDSYDISVFDFPALTRADAELQYPEYTERESRVIQDVRRINAVEGTKAELSFFLNKPVVTGRLVPVGENNDDREGEAIKLKVDPEDPTRMVASVEMEKSEKYELLLVDSESRSNRTPPKFVLNVAINKPPSLKLLTPARDIQASAIEEVLLSANVWDDFGVKQFGVSYGIAGEDEFNEVLGKQLKGRSREQRDHLLELEAIKAKPDDLVSYYFWAEDVGPDGRPRRTESDMFFAEVRHFDEIYRQGQAQTQDQQQQQQQQQQGGQNAQQAQELAELQKEIINATWKLVRREDPELASFEFGEDVKLIASSQASAIEQLDELAGQLEDAESKSYVEKARNYMVDAARLLTESSDDEDVGKLKPALSNEKSAYQGLLKLRAREHEVTQQQQQQQQQSSQQQNSQRQQQLDQLNLEQDENRYENERTAMDQTQEQQEEREDRQVLNRLRELAQRQADLNERVKELQNALEEAETEEEEEEIKRRLKSLREQQEQMLRDTEELAERMNEEINQERMAEESEKLAESRDNQQRALDALEQGQVSRAAAEGTRAERELEDLKDEFQDRTAGQFTERMREMRNEIQNLEEKQQEIAKDLAEPESRRERTGERPDLRETESEEGSLESDLAEQQRKVEDIRQQMRETIEEAEVFEPLLAEELYDTYRRSEASRPDRALESARESFERGWMDDARVEEQRAREGIGEIKEGIEKAAERILGNETDALRNAARTLEDLNRQLQNEIDENSRSQTDEDSAANRSADSENSVSREGPDSEGRQQAENERADQRRQGTGERSDDRGESQQRADQRSEQEREASGQRGGAQSQEGEEQDSESEEDPQRGAGNRRTSQREESSASESEESQNNQSGQPQDRSGQSRQSEGGQPQESERGQTGDSEQAGGGNQPEGESRQEDSRQQMTDQMRNFTPANEDQQGGASQQRTLDGPGNQRMMRPLTGDDFREWSDNLRDVEEMVPDPDLRAEASRIREEAREFRKEWKERHSAEPNWDLVKLKIAKPLAELQDRVAEELMRRTAKDALVPLDRDPVPVEYQDAVRKYYERLGKGN